MALVAGQLGSPSSARANNETLSGDVILSTDDTGRLIIAVDAAKDGVQPDGIIDLYFWYRSIQPFPTGLAAKLSKVNIVHRGRLLEISSPFQGVDLVLTVDANDQTPLARIFAQDLSALDGVYARLASISSQKAAGSDKNESTYTLKGGFELGRKTLKTPVALSAEAIAQSIRPLNEESASCSSGGPGSTSCSCSFGGDSCGVSCSTGYYACCSCSSHPTNCTCVRN
jgi:hypothetical protein